MKKLIVIAWLLCLSICAKAQFSRLSENIQYNVTTQFVAGAGDNSPFWFTNNRYGLGTTKTTSGLVRMAILRNVQVDSLRLWRIGYGVDLASPINKETGYFCVQQAFVDIEWKKIRLSFGQKERPSELKNPLLTTGGMTLGMNARPIPQIRFEIPDFCTLPGTNGILSFKGHLAYGWYTDNKWQRNFNAGTDHIYTSNSKFHSKAIFFRIGNYHLFPLEVTGGLEMACQYDGTGWNIQPYGGGNPVSNVNLGGNLWTAFLPNDGDVNDENYANAVGNHVGSWHLRLALKQDKWNANVYMEHFFEDHSQMFFQYGWKDMLLGLELNLPSNPILSTLVYEYNTTMHQSGPIYHDKTEENKQQISARDEYYRNHIYGGWQMGGFVLGNPLILSPIYNTYLGSDGNLSPLHDRVRVYHIGLMGSPSSEWSWRAMFTHQFSLGTYVLPVVEPCVSNYLLLEATYKPRWCRGLSLTAAFGHNDGNVLGVSNGAMLSLRFDGWINKKP